MEGYFGDSSRKWIIWQMIDRRAQRSETDSQRLPEGKRSASMGTEE